MNDFKFELGQTVGDSITTFQGVVFCRTQWLNGCNTYGVKSTELKDGKPQEAVHFDEPQLRELGDTTPVTASRATGGPISEPPKQVNR